MKRNSLIRLTAVLMAAAMILMIAACGKKETEPKTFIDVLDDGSVVANFDQTGKGTAGGSGITIGENEYLMIDTALTEGKVHVTVVRTGNDINNPPTSESDTPATIDYIFEESGNIEYMEIKPGDYMFNVSVEEKATGTITASKKSFPEDSASGDATAAQ